MKTALSLMGLLAIGMVAFGIWFGVHHEQVNNRFNLWLDDCIAQGGIAGLTELGSRNTLSGDDYECYIDGKIVTLSGWENY
jgi:hypothetical protein